MRRITPQRSIATQGERELRTLGWGEPFRRDNHAVGTRTGPPQLEPPAWECTQSKAPTKYRNLHRAIRTA